MKSLNIVTNTLRLTLFLSFFFANILLVPQYSSAVCRNLVPTDPYYDGWTYCCELNTTLGHSYWIKRGGNGKKERYGGSCEYWGITNRPQQPVCRNLRSGDPYFNNWSRCCDEGKSQSRWFKRWGGHKNGTLYDGDCRSWGITPS